MRNQIVMATCLLSIAVAAERTIAAPPTTAPATQAAAMTEAEKIEHLIDYIAGLKGAVFIRNGSEHSPAEAAKHLRDKLRRAGSRIKTAEQFIEHLASKSSMSGEVYRIRFQDGTERPSGDVLTEELAKIEK